MGAIDALIAGAQSRAVGYSNAAYAITQQLAATVTKYDPVVIDAVVPPAVTILPYVPPTPSVGINPTYQPPTSSMPAVPLFQGVIAAPSPISVQAPVVSIDGLFAHNAPGGQTPEFTGTFEGGNAAKLQAAIDAIPKPEPRQYVFPTIESLDLPLAPTLTLPAYNPGATPQQIAADSVDYSNTFASTYASMSRDMQAFINDTVSAWTTQYAPNYSGWMSQLQSKIDEGLGSQALPDQFEAAMFSRAQGRTQREFESAVTGIYDSFKRSGMMEPPGTVNAGVMLARLKGAEALANQSTDIYIDRKKAELAHTEFTMTLVAAQITTVRAAAITYAQAVGDTMGKSVEYAKILADQTSRVFEHLIASTEVNIKVLGLVNAQFDSQLKSALSGLEGHKLVLEAERLKIGVTDAQVKVIADEIAAAANEVQMYTAMVEAIAKTISLYELDMKEYEVQGAIMGYETQAYMAQFEAYKALMAGDQAKADGELSKIKVYEGQVTAAKTVVDAAIATTQAGAAYNSAQAQIFSAEAEAYKLLASNALTTFMAQVETRKMELTVDNHQLTNSIEAYKTEIEGPRITADIGIKTYLANIDKAGKEIMANIEYQKINESAGAAAASSASSLGAAALGSLNTVASSATQAAA